MPRSHVGCCQTCPCTGSGCAARRSAGHASDSRSPPCGATKPGLRGRSGGSSLQAGNRAQKVHHLVDSALVPDGDENELLSLGHCGIDRVQKVVQMAADKPQGVGRAEATRNDDVQEEHGEGEILCWNSDEAVHGDGDVVCVTAPEMNDADENSAAVDVGGNDCGAEHDESGDEGEKPGVVGGAAEEGAYFELLGVGEEEVHADEEAETELA